MLVTPVMRIATDKPVLQAGLTSGTFMPEQIDQVTAYNSYEATPSIIFQVPGAYELLVWDTAGDGSGNNAGDT